MPLYTFEGSEPTVHPSAFVAPTATLVGDVTVEEGASVWYGAILGSGCLIANGTIVLDGATVGPRTLVAAGSVVRANAEIPGGKLAAGSPAEVKRDIEGTPAEFWVTANPSAYRDLARRHLEGISAVTE